MYDSLAVRQVFCMPIDKFTEKAVGRCDSAKYAERVRLVMAQARLADECGAGDITPRWVARGARAGVAPHTHGMCRGALACVCACCSEVLPAGTDDCQDIVRLATWQGGPRQGAANARRTHATQHVPGGHPPQQGRLRCQTQNARSTLTYSACTVHYASHPSHTADALLPSHVPPSRTPRPPFPPAPGLPPSTPWSPPARSAGSTSAGGCCGWRRRVGLRWRRCRGRALAPTQRRSCSQRGWTDSRWAGGGG